MSTKFMSDNSLSELVTKIKDGFLPIKTVSAVTGENSADLDTYTTSGVYIISGDGADVYPGDTRFGYLIVLRYSSMNIAQFWIDKDVDSYYLDFPIYCRQKKTTTWSGITWTPLPSQFDIAYLQEEIDNIIKDSSIESTSTWSSNKINNLIVPLQNNKLDSSDFTLSNITGTLSIAKGGTGATDKSTALANLAYNTVVSGDSTDLNSYTSQAINCFTSTVPAASNIPTGSSGVGMLAVVTSDRTDLYQVWFEMSGGKTDMYMRTRISGTWSSWGKVYNTNDDFGFVNPSVAGVGTDVSHCFVCKRAGMTTINGYVVATPTSTSANSVIVARLSSEYYPNTERVTAVCINESVSENIYYTVLVNTNGYISIRNVAKIEGVNTQTFRFNITYPSDF